MWALYIYSIMILIVLVYFGNLIIKRRKYTHEKFAFYALGSLIFFSASAIIPIFSGGSAFELVVRSLFLLIGREVDNGSSFSDKILSLIVLLLLGYVAVKFHSQWPEQATDRKNQLQRQGRETTILSDALAELAAIRTSQPLKMAEEEDDARYETVADLADEGSWRRRAFRLLMAYSSQYQIDSERDWISEINCYFCSYGKSGASVVVFCPDKVPTFADFEKIKMECESQAFKPKKFVIICRIAEYVAEETHYSDLPKPEILSEIDIIKNISDFSSYGRYIIKRYEADLIATSTKLTLRDTYVPVGGVIINSNVNSGDDVRNKKVENIEEYISQWSLEGGPRHLAVLGDYGQGKSTLMLKIAYNYFKFGIGERVPVIIELRGRSPRSEDLHQILYQWCKKFGFREDSLLALHEAGKIILILDGFDEMDYVGDAEVRYTHLRRIWEFAKYSKSKILVTGRPNFFFGTKERRRALLIRDESEGRPYCEEIRLSHLTIPQAEKAVAGFSPNVVGGIGEALRDGASNISLSELLLRPSTLIWAATVWGELATEIGNAPVLSAHVVRRFIRQANERQQSKGIDTALMRSERQYLTSAVAMKIHAKQAGTNQISAGQLRTTIAECLESMPDLLRDFCDPGEDKKVPAKERFQQFQRLVETVATEIRSGGVLVEDVSKPDTFRFAHKSFYEYLVAEMIAAKFFPRVVSEMEKFSSIDVKNTSFELVEVTYLGLMNSGIDKQSLISPQVIEIDQFAGETVISLIIESLPRKNEEWSLSPKLSKQLARATRNAWCGRGLIGAAALMEYLDVDQLPKMSTSSHLLRILSPALKTYTYPPLFRAPFFLPMRSRVRSWMFGCLGLGLSKPEELGLPINLRSLGIRGAVS